MSGIHESHFYVSLSRRSRFTIVECRNLVSKSVSRVKNYKNCPTVTRVFALLWAAPLKNRDRNLLGMSFRPPKMSDSIWRNGKSLKFSQFGAKLHLDLGRFSAKRAPVGRFILSELSRDTRTFPRIQLSAMRTHYRDQKITQKLINKRHPL